MNVIWCCFNVIILGVCTAVARELQQRRSAARVGVITPLFVKLSTGKIIPGETFDISSSGTGIHIPRIRELRAWHANTNRVSFAGSDIDLPATVVKAEGSRLRVNFKNLSIAEQEVLTIALYSRADSWLGWGEARESDRVLRSLFRIFRISVRGLCPPCCELHPTVGQAASARSPPLVPESLPCDRRPGGRFTPIACPISATVSIFHGSRFQCLHVAAEINYRPLDWLATHPNRFVSSPGSAR